MWQHPSKLKTFYWMLALLQTQDICHTSAQPGKRTIRSPMDTPAYWNFFKIYPCPICLYFVAHHFTYLHFILNFQPGRRTVRPPRVSSWFKWFLSICLCQNMFFSMCTFNYLHAWNTFVLVPHPIFTAPATWNFFLRDPSPNFLLHCNFYAPFISGLLRTADSISALFWCDVNRDLVDGVLICTLNGYVPPPHCTKGGK